jgi:hypothetical protein
MVNMVLVNSNVDYYRTDKFDLSCGVGTAQAPPHLSNKFVEAVSTLAAQPWTTFFTITQKPRSARGGHGGARISDDFHMLKAVKTIFKFHTQAHWNGYLPSGEDCLGYTQALTRGKNNFLRRWARKELSPNFLLSTEKHKTGLIHVHGLVSAPVIPNRNGESKWDIHLLRRLIKGSKHFGVEGFDISTVRDTASAVGYCLKYITKDPSCVYDIDLNGLPETLIPGSEVRSTSNEVPF